MILNKDNIKHDNNYLDLIKLTFLKFDYLFKGRKRINNKISFNNNVKKIF